jgi:tetratricopeptide (TPR) repeat protein
MLRGKQTVSQLRVTKTVVLLLIVAFTWQSSVALAISKAISDSPEQHKIREEHGNVRQAVPTPPDLALIDDYQGLQNYDLGRWQETIVAFSDAIAVNPDFAVAYFGLGVTYSKLENWEEALIYFKKTVELSPAFVQGNLKLGITYNILGLKGEAVKALKKRFLSTLDLFRRIILWRCVTYGMVTGHQLWKNMKL